MNLAAIAEQLRARVGIDPQSLGANLLRNVVANRMRALGLTDPGRYAEHLGRSRDEFDALVDEIIVPETWLFRGGPLFAFLAGHVREATASRPPGKPFRILSAPCSTGEEPYSLAIALVEAGVPRERWTLEAIDVSARNLERARQARYGEAAFRETPAALRARYFRSVAGGGELEPSLCDLVAFRRANLLDPGLLAGQGPFDLVFCRNLLIYLDTAARTQVLANLDRLLAPDGLLCTGHAEPLSLLDERFQPTGPVGHFLFRRKGKDNRRPPGRAEAPPAPPKPAAPSRPQRPGFQPPPAAAPVAPPDRLRQARAEADAGDLGRALELCLAHLAVAGPSGDGYCLLGVIHQARQERTEAAACFRKALYLEPRHGEALLHLMLLHQEIGDGAAADRLRRRLERNAAGGEP
jgi:chemotaxis protein methyltransferase WspC